VTDHELEEGFVTYRSLRIVLRRLQAALAALLVAAVLPALTHAAPTPVAVMTPEPVPNVLVPPGFKVTRIAQLPQYKQPTSIAYGPDGALYIAVLGGEIYRLDDNGALTQWAGPFQFPLGIAWHEDTLYLGAVTDDRTVGQILTLRDTDGNGQADEIKVLIPDLPIGIRARHLINGLAFGPDDKLYVTNGSFENKTRLTDDLRRGTIQRYNPDGTIPKDNPDPTSPVIATGLRNPYDVAIHPVDGTIFATENGRDDLGDTMPPEELNHIIPGRDYGWPDCWGINGGTNCEGTQPPVVELEPHASANGLTFYTGDQFGPEYKNDIFIAEYGAGSFGTRPYGKKVERVELTRQGDTYTARVTTFLVGLERPLDVVTAKNGGLIVAEFGDVNAGTGAIYRVDRDPAANPFAPVPALNGDNPPVYVEATGHTVAQDFYDYWAANGGLAMFGYPISQEFLEDGVVVQYFERARFERHITERKEELRVKLGLLGRTITVGREAEGPFAPVGAFPDSPDRRYFPETGHSLSGGFKHYWDTHGGVSVLGLPISEEFTEVNPDTGQSYTVQYFERGRFEYHPEHAGTPYEVLLGRLGAQVVAGRYGAT
jgi:glucose/arabinose dehydrogenase